MALFGRKKEKEVAGCCGRAGVEPNNSKQMNATEEGEKSVKVLGSGCTKCNELEANTKKALEQIGMDTTIIHVTDFAQIATYGVMSTPALVVDGKVLSYGKVLKTEEIVALLQKARP